MQALIQPKEIEIDGKTYILSKFDCFEGREIVINYFKSNIPKIGDYRDSEKMMEKALSFVAVKVGDHIQRLTHRELIKSHVHSDFPFETLLKLEKAILEYNISFFQKGGNLDSWIRYLVQTVQSLSKMSTDLSGQSSQTEKQPSMN